MKNSTNGKTNNRGGRHAALRFGILVLLFALAGGNAFGQQKVAEWKVPYLRTTFILSVHFVSSSYYSVSVKRSDLQTPYQYYLVAYRDKNGQYSLCRISIGNISGLGYKYAWETVTDNNVKAQLELFYNSTLNGESECTRAPLSQFGYSADFTDIDPARGVALNNSAVKSYLLPTASDGICNAPLNELREATTEGKFIIILFEKSNSSEVDGVTFSWNSEYFQGERELFTKQPSKLYYQKAFSLMNAFFNLADSENDFKTVFGSVLPSEYSMSDDDWTVFGESQKGEISRMISVLGNGMKSFLKEIQYYYSSIDRRSYTVKVFDIDNIKKSGSGRTYFTELYGSERNPYLMAYLYYAYSHNYPIFSAMNNMSGSRGKNWKQYNKLTVDEGKLLAAAAMRYYTWGIEYSQGESSYSQSPRVFQGVDAYNQIIRNGTIEWFQTDDEDTSTKNYYPGQLYNLSTLPLANVYTDGIVISLPDNSQSIISQERYKVPFLSGNAGYPLPYSCYGVDSPKTFAYKMYKQLMARKVLEGSAVFDNTTKARKRILVQGNQVDQIEGYPLYLTSKDSRLAQAIKTSVDLVVTTSEGSVHIKPFLPGGRSGTTNEAGVDPMGFLSGSLAMTSFASEVLNMYNNPSSKRLDEYYRMAPGTVIGLDDQGEPVYNAGKFASLLFSPFRLEPGDLERCTVVVPDISLVQQGDLIIHFGTDEESKGDPTHIGIVVALGGTKPEFGSDGSSYLENIYVVSVRKDFRQVTLGTWGNPEGKFGGFTTEPEKYHIRRFVKNTGTYDFIPASWDVCSSVSSMSVEIVYMYENTRTRDKETTRERWIPNTGEFLCLRLKGNLLNAAGGVINPAEISNGLPCEIIVTGAIDRGAQGQTEIPYVNQGGKFELCLIEDSENPSVIKKVGLLTRNGDSTYTLSTASGNSDLYNSDGALLSSSNYLYINEDEEILGQFGDVKSLVLAIRPENAAQARPGDDLLLQFNVRIPGNPQGLLANPVTLKEKDYIAVYDKRLLWRANLYIDEGTGDWNDVHPWNAPPTGVSINDFPAWGKNGTTWVWGNNDWNRTYTPNADNSALVFGTGDGKQVVTFTDYPWTPLRIRTGDLPNWSNRVAYDYEANGTTIRAWDSPFDFIYKLRQQKLALRAHFVGVIQNNPQSGNNAGVFPGGTGQPDIVLPAQGQRSNTNLSNWTSTSAPYDLWKYYWKEPVDGIRAYIPGLGFRLYSINTDYDGYVGGGLNDISITFTDRASAGADCVGFAQRAASYTGSRYMWADGFNGGFPRDRAEGNNDPDGTARAGRSGYPHNLTNGSFVIVTREGISASKPYFTINAGEDNGPSLARFNEIKGQFLRIVPGDIIRYGDTTHIGIVASVDYTKMEAATSIDGLMRAVVVIESVFSMNINYVVKRNMMAGNGELFNDGNNIPQSWHLGSVDSDTGEIPMRSWSIERLGCRQ